ncbi:ABC transporter permease [Nostoc sp. CHAB 5844]|nr:ABC transporter permease [Nostoc sp. CHAB 5844]
MVQTIYQLNIILEELFRLKIISGHIKVLREFLYILTKYRQLTWEMAKREITEKYAGQVLGTFWAVLHPLFLMSVYIFIFVFVFKIKIGGTKGMPLDYTTYLLSGLIPWLTIQESMSKASVAIVSNANLVKQVVFPIEILPIKGVISSLLTQGVFLLILIIYVVLSQHSIPLTYGLIPLIILLQFFFIIGISYILASVGAYFRDIKDIIQVITVIGVYLMPIFYLPEQVPSGFQQLLYFNPFSHLIWCYQDTLYYGYFAHPWSWLIFIILSHVIFTIGYKLFGRLKIMFGNVL